MAWEQMKDQQMVRICEMFGWLWNVWNVWVEVRFRLAWYAKIFSLAMSGLGGKSPATFVPGPDWNNLPPTNAKHKSAINLVIQTSSHGGGNPGRQGGTTTPIQYTRCHPIAKPTAEWCNWEVAGGIERSPSKFLYSVTDLNFVESIVFTAEWE